MREGGERSRWDEEMVGEKGEEVEEGKGEWGRRKWGRRGEENGEGKEEKITDPNGGREEVRVKRRWGWARRRRVWERRRRDGFPRPLGEEEEGRE